jgi:hypothetical protein
VGCAIGKLIALHHHDLGVGLGEHAGSQETCYACAKHHGPVTMCVHRYLLSPVLEVGSVWSYTSRRGQQITAEHGYAMAGDLPCR